MVGALLRVRHAREAVPQTAPRNAPRLQTPAAARRLIVTGLMALSLCGAPLVLAATPIVDEPGVVFPVPGFASGLSMYVVDAPRGLVWVLSDSILHRWDVTTSDIRSIPLSRPIEKLFLGGGEVWALTGTQTQGSRSMDDTSTQLVRIDQATSEIHSAGSLGLYPSSLRLLETPSELWPRQ